MSAMLLCRKCDTYQPKTAPDRCVKCGSEDIYQEWEAWENDEGDEE